MSDPKESDGEFRPRAGRLVLLAVFAAAILAHLPALRAGYVWDDDSYVTGNPTLRSSDGLRRIWLEPGATTQYYPLVHTTFWIEYRLWRLRPVGFHAVNVLLHAGSAALLFALLKRLRSTGASLAALLFAVHPVHVESVAWIAERKNVLSGILYLAAAWSYLRFAPPEEGGGGDEGDRGPRRHYFLSLAFFLLALLAKTVTATLPAGLLVVVWWKRGRIARSDVAPLLPFFALGALAGLGTLYIESNLLGAQGKEWDLSFAGRCLLAGRALVFYASKLAWPASLSFVYPRWEVDPGAVRQYLYPAGVALAGIVLFAARRRIGRGPVGAFAYFAVTLAPALGFFDVYPFRFSYVADHFQYLASIGPLTLFAAAVTLATKRFGRGAARAAPFYASVLLVLLGTLAWKQAGAYRDAETLWRDTIAKNDSAWMAHLNLGQILASSGRPEEAIRSYEAALRIRPDSDKAENDLGLAYASLGRQDEAVRHYRAAIRLNEGTPSARGNLALALLSQGRADEAVATLREALALRPRAPELWTNLGVALVQKADIAGAEEALREAIRLAPSDAESRYRLGVLLMQAGRLEEANAAMREALRLEEGNDNARRAYAEIERRLRAGGGGN